MFPLRLTRKFAGLNDEAQAYLEEQMDLLLENPAYCRHDARLLRRIVAVTPVIPLVPRPKAAKVSLHGAPLDQDRREDLVVFRGMRRCTAWLETQRELERCS